MVRGVSPGPRLRQRGSSRATDQPVSSARSRGQALDSIIRRGSQRPALYAPVRRVWAFLVAFGDLGFVFVFFLVPGADETRYLFSYFISNALFVFLLYFKRVICFLTLFQMRYLFSYFISNVLFFF